MLIDSAPLLKIVPIFAAALIAPGPDFMMISSMALTRGRWAGVKAACGIAIGVVLFTLLALFGMTVVFARFGWLLTAIRVAGGVYLVYLGIQLWRASLRKSVEGGDPVPPAKQRAPLTTGFLTNLTNPKAIAFFTSIFAFALPEGSTGATKIAIVAVMAVMPILWFGLVSFCLSAPMARRVYLRASAWIDRVTGTILALFGVRLLLTARN